MKSVEEIKKHLRNGDYAKVAALSGVSRDYAIKLMGRPTAAKHKEVVRAARKVARANQQLGL